jgi:RNA polymerase sigma-70 factor (ECF subfamily)
MSVKQTTFSSPLFIEQVKQGNSQAFTSLVEAYSDHLFNAALGLRFSVEQAQDLAHSTWVTFFEVAHRFEGRSHIRTFLFGIFYNKVKELRRSDKKEGTGKVDPFETNFDKYFDETEHWIERPKDPSRYSENEETLAIISKCLEHLPENQREVFILKLILEEEPKEICHKMGISSTNLRQLLFRGKGHLKECIDKMYA